MGERLSTGLKVGRYEIVAPWGAGGGGGGRMYRGRDCRLERAVTLRAVDAGGPDRRRRFLEAARKLAAIGHPNIATVYDFVCGNEVDVIVLEPLTGETLAAAIPVGGMRPKVVLRLAAQIADALAAAHAHGIAHGNLATDAILLEEKRRVRILDFGLAAPAPPDAPAGESVFEGDLRASGAILYEALTGRRPGTAPSPLPDTVPSALAGLVMGCLRGETGTAAELLAALAAITIG